MSSGNIFQYLKLWIIQALNFGKKHIFFSLSVILATLAGIWFCEDPQRWRNALGQKDLFFATLVWLSINIAFAVFELVYEVNTRVRSFFFLAGAAVAIAGYYLKAPSHSLSLIKELLLLSVGPLLAGAGLFRKGSDFQYKLLVRALNSLFETAILSIGAFILITIAMLSIDYLLIKIPKLGNHIGSLGCFVFVCCAPFLFLSRLAEKESEMNFLEKIIEKATKFVLLPAIVIYDVIVGLYAIKILLAWQLPRGIVSKLVITCVVFTIIADVFLANASASKDWWNKYRKIFYISQWPFLIFLWIAALTRVSQYGITPERYFLLMLSGCLTVTSLVALWGNKLPVPCFSFTMLCSTLFSVFTPMGFIPVSFKSQLTQLEYLLKKNSLLKDNLWQKATATLSAEEGIRLTSVFSYLFRNYAPQYSLPFLSGKAKVIWEEKAEGRELDPERAILSYYNLKPSYEWHKKEEKEKANAMSTLELRDQEIQQLNPHSYFGKISCASGAKEDGFVSSVEDSAIPFIIIENSCKTISVLQRGNLLCPKVDLLSRMSEPIVAKDLALEISGDRCNLKIIFTSFKVTKPATLGVKSDDAKTVLEYTGTVWFDTAPFSK